MFVTCFHCSIPISDSLLFVYLLNLPFVGPIEVPQGDVKTRDNFNNSIQRNTLYRVFYASFHCNHMWQLFQLKSKMISYFPSWRAVVNNYKCNYQYKYKSRINYINIKCNFSFSVMERISLHFKRLLWTRILIRK